MKPVGPRGLPYNGGVPRHWNCRSAEIPITYTFEEMGIKGLGETRRVVDKGARASMFGPTTKRTFDGWLGSLSAEDQDEVLGSKRLGKAFREGRLSTKNLVDAAGRPYLFRDLENMGLIDPRYAPRYAPESIPGSGRPTTFPDLKPEDMPRPAEGPWGEYESLEALRAAILADGRDPNSPYQEYDREIEKLVGERADLRELQRGLDPHDPRYRELSDKIKDAFNREREIEHDKQFYFARKYLYPVTEGRADLRRQIDISDGIPKPIRDTIDRGISEFEQMIGKNSVLSEEWNRARDGGYWEDLEDGDGRNWAEKFFTRDGLKRIHFTEEAKNRNNSNAWGGGPESWIHIAEDRGGDVIHELGHTLEGMSSWVKTEANRYLEWRCGENFDDIEHPYQAGAWKGLHPGRVTYFMEEYGGAFYGRNPRRPALTEFVSKHLELMMTQTHEMAWHDPRSFDFMLHLLTRRTWNPPG